MQENQLYEYAVIRVVPKVEREEFLNVGIILYCKKQGFLKAKYSLDKQRLGVFHAELDLEDLEKHLQTWELVRVTRYSDSLSCRKLSQALKCEWRSNSAQIWRRVFFGPEKCFVRRQKQRPVAGSRAGCGLMQPGEAHP